MDEKIVAIPRSLITDRFPTYSEYDPAPEVRVCHASQGSADLTALQKRAYQTIYVMYLLNFPNPSHGRRSNSTTGW